MLFFVVELKEGFAQSSYPDRPIRIIVPSAPGGPSDFGARLIGDEISKRLGRQVVVDNRSGAATMIGSEAVAKALPDGYTLLMSPSTLAINPAFYKKMPYNALIDFAPITQTVFVPNVIVVNPSLPVKSVKELIDYAKVHPNNIRYASAGYGTNPHLAIELLMSMAQIKMMHVPYKGDMPGMTAVMGGEVEIMANTSLSLIIPHLETGRLRALGVTTAKRISALPNIPTLSEAGLTGYEAVQWSGLLAPSKTPKEIIAKLSKEVIAILLTPDAKVRLASVGCEIVASTPEEFSSFMQAETIKWAAVVKAAGIQPE